jgi:hypothetical protein
MSHEIDSIIELPSIEDIKRLSQSLAMLDLILIQEWEYRYFSFNSTWDSGEMMASMRNGEGDEYFILFSKDGVAGKIFLKNIESAKSKDLLHMIPDEFSSFKTEPAFKLDYISCCFWKKHSDNQWRVSPALEKIPLLKFIVGKEKYYQEWAEEYLGVDLEGKVVTSIFEHVPLSNNLVHRLNEDVSLGDIMEDVKEIGYPIEI